MERLILLHAYTGDQEVWLNPRYIREVRQEGDATRIRLHINYPPSSRTGVSLPSGGALSVKEPVSEVARLVNRTAKIEEE